MSKLATRYTPVPKCSGVEVLKESFHFLELCYIYSFYLSNLRLKELTRTLP